MVSVEVLIFNDEESAEDEFNIPLFAEFFMLFIYIDGGVNEPLVEFGILLKTPNSFTSNKSFVVLLSFFGELDTVFGLKNCYCFL